MTTDWIPSLWTGTFADLQEDELDYGDQWTLNLNYTQTDTISQADRRRGWKVFSHCAHGRFKCSSCSKIWSSARVVVLFRYRLRSEAERGAVIMRPFGQACQRCGDSHFYRPGFSQQDVEDALNRLFGKIRKNCYGEEDYEDNGSGGFDEVRTKPHERALCEGCRMGICCQEE